MKTAFAVLALVAGASAFNGENEDWWFDVFFRAHVCG